MFVLRFPCQFGALLLAGSAWAAFAADELPAALSKRGMQFEGTQLVLPAEDSLAQQIKNIKGIQKKYLDALRLTQQADLEVLSARDEYATLKAREKQLNQQLQNAGGDLGKAQAINQALKQDQQRLRDINKLTGVDREDISAAYAVLKEVRKAYIAAIRDLEKTVAEGKQQYSELASDSEAMKALEELSKKTSKEYTFGPTRFFDNNCKAAEKYASFVKTATIPTEVKTWHYIPVSVNGKPAKSLTIAPGYNTIHMSEKTAAAFGIIPNDFDSDTSYVDQNQTNYKCKRVLARTVKVGEFEVENVSIVVFDTTRANQDDQFGGAFLRYFDWDLNKSANTLTLTEVKDPAVKPLTFKTKKKR